MYHKARNTLVAASVALAMLAAGYGVGNPPSEYPTGLDLTAQSGAAADVVASSKRARGVQRHMAMPFFSFAPLLPKQGG
jgi:hypothetical protein